MVAVPKSRVVSALLLFLMLAISMPMRPADAPLPSALAPSERERESVRRHPPRLLSRREIFQAIQDDLTRMGIAGSTPLQPEDLNIQSSIPACMVDRGLHVLRMDFDPFRRVVIFELWASREPQYLPFEVTTRRDPESLGLTPYLARKPWEAGAGARARGAVISQGESPVRFKAPVLVKPGRPATLVMLGQNVRVTTAVVPLQPGVRGQSILVRDLATARVMTAEVVDEGLLQTHF